MTDLLASLPPKPLPAHTPAENVRGFEDDHVVTGDFGQAASSDDAGLTFSEFLDIINPLHHIPVVSTVYRAITGDQISPESRFFGGMLFGGPGGAIAAGIASLFEEASGGDLGQHLAELVNDLTGGGDDQDNAPSIAAAKTGTADGPRAAIDADAVTTGNTVHTAALAGTAITPAAVNLNRIAYNPKAAFGVHQNLAKSDILPAPAAAKAFPARALAMPFGAPKMGHPTSTNSVSPDQPVLRPAVFSASDSAPAQAGTEPVQAPAARATIPAPSVSEAVNRSRRQQADLMLAQWAAQQMARQTSAPAPAGTDHTGREDSPAAAPVNAPAHPMLPPRDASPEWYAQAMGQALNQYRNSAGTGAGGTPAVSVRR